MELESVTITGFRNLADGTVAFGGGVNLILGANGQGKTNLLEAICTLGTARSFRSAAHRRLVRHGETSYRLEGRLVGRTGALVLEILWRAGNPPERELRINGIRVGVAEYLRVFPMVVLSSADRDLVTGQPAVRRAFLDRLAFLLVPASLEDLRRYLRVLRQRNAAMARGVPPEEFSAWSDELAAAAGRVVVRRRAAVEALRRGFGEIYGRLRGSGFPDVTLEYHGEAWLPPDGDEFEVAEEYRKRYHSQGEREREAGYTLWGPHRHDLLLQASGRAVRDTLSAGQVKTVAAALRFAFLGEVERGRGERLPLGIDDVDAELDEEMLARTVRLAGDDRQLFLTSARDRAALGDVRAERRMWVSAGRVLTTVPHKENA